MNREFRLNINTYVNAGERMKRILIEARLREHGFDLGQHIDITNNGDHVLYTQTIKPISLKEFL